MKKIGSIALAALAFASCSKPVTDESQSPPPSATPARAPTAAAPAPAPAPSSAPKPVAAATPAPELAPAGVFYLLTPARIETPDGIRGLPPGTGVKLVRAGVYLTPYGELSLDPRQLTNDMGAARRARDADRTAQSAASAQRAAESARLAEQARLAAAAAAKAAAQRPAATPAYIEGTARQATGLQSSTALGSGHTKTVDGWLWQKSLDGSEWLPVKRLRDGSTEFKPLPRPVR